MPFMFSYGCSTAAGRGTSALAEVLHNGADVARGGDAYYFPNASNDSVRERLVGELCASFREAGKPKDINRYGVILASTKGICQDFIMLDGAGSQRDPLTPLLDHALLRLELRPSRSLCVSNACASTLAAVRLAEVWLKQDLDAVLILAADAVTPFVERGFHSLKLLSPTRPDPFGREGFWLGEAAAALWITKSGKIKIHSRIDSDGCAVTKPSLSSLSLKRAISRIPGSLESKPDLILAHATGTLANEETEDLVFNELFPQVPRMASKPYLGHTLGASAALDLIYACERIRMGQERRILISSLGFGGTQAAALVESP